MINVKVPGKLYIAGEYAVVTPGNKALITAVDSFIHVSIEPAKHFGTLYSEGLISEQVSWTRNKDQIYLEDEQAFSYITRAIEVMESYVKEQGVDLSYFHLKIFNELGEKDGRKYGLGSSGAVVVAVIRGLAQFYQLQLSDLQVFKLAVITSRGIEKKGSCGDIAASSFARLIAYQTFDFDWLDKQLEADTISQIVEDTWPLLDIQVLDFPKELHFLIGWTGKAASTPKLVSQVETAKDYEEHEQFLAKSKACVESLIQAFANEDIPAIFSQIETNRELLKGLQKHTSVEIETPKLAKLIAIANKYSAAAKTSGAGGGDCGIAFIQKDKKIEKLLGEWEEEGIIPLPFSIYGGN